MGEQPTPLIYEIRIQGRLDPLWAAWFEGMTLTYTLDPASGLACTTLTGPVLDQPALHGLLAKIRDLNLVLLGVTTRLGTR